MTTVDSESLKEEITYDSSNLDVILSLQQGAYRREGPPSASVRRDRLDRLALVLVKNSDQLAKAVDEDFGGRPHTATLAGEVASSIQEIVALRRHVGGWMKPRHPQPRYLQLVGIKAFVEPHPLGVVGVMAPWNFPIALAIQPVAAALAAGNRAMLKMSELTPRTSEVLATAVAECFSIDEFAVITGGVDVAVEFSHLPFDHLLFTGASSVGRSVAKAAAENLVPVTLELGGKNPTVVGRDADMERAAKRITKARLANSGQICLSPDYVFVPRGSEEAFIAKAEAAFRSAVPSVASNDDYCAIVNDRHYQRITALIDDARSKGASIIEATNREDALRAKAVRRIPPTIVSGVTEEMTIASEEVFGPVLSVLPYDSIIQVIDYVNDRPSPLAAYWFGGDTKDFHKFKSRTRSGGVTRNDFALHAALEGLPFGGVGHSGSGYYHGRSGFDTFSHLRAIAVSPRAFSPVALLSPPFSTSVRSTLTWFFSHYSQRLQKRVSRFSTLSRRD